MHQPKKTVVAALAGSMAAAALLSACGAGADPASSPAAPPSQAAPAASPSQAAPAASPSTASPAPSADPSAAAPQVKAAAEKFVRSALVIGYPDKDAQDYYGRVEPLMTKSGFAAQKKDLGNLDTKAAKQAYAQRIRVTTKTTSEVRVTAVDGSRASAQGTYRLVRQQQRDGRWKTLKTDDDKTTLKLTLVDEDGTWLVDSAK